jgi:serine/threonine protein kinase
MIRREQTALALLHDQDGSFAVSMIRPIDDGLVMPLMTMGSLGDAIRRFPTGVPITTLWDVAASVLSTLEVMSRISESHGASLFAHLDIKPDNILFEDRHLPRLADFSCSAVLAPISRLASYSMGSPLYMSPERVRGESFDERADIWGLGMTLWHAAIGERFPVAKTAAKHLRVIEEARWKTDLAPKDFALRSLVCALLEEDQNERMCASEVLHSEAPWSEALRAALERVHRAQARRARWREHIKPRRG